MKKAIAIVSVLSSLALSVVPAFADSNGNITINGGSGNTYNINQTTTVNSGTTINLTDIGGHWAEKYIKDLVKKGVLSGGADHKFNPNGDVTRAQWATMVTRYFDLTSTSTTQDFNDVPTNNWAYKYVEAAEPYFDKYTDLNGGYDFKPNQGAKREDVTYTLVSILSKLDPSVQVMDAQSADQLLQSKFSDSNDIAANLRPYVATAVKYDLIHGDGKGHFLPDKTLSRAEAATLLDRLQGNSVIVGGGTSTGGTTTGGTTTGGTTTGGTTTGGTTDGGTTTGGTTDGGTTTGGTTDGGNTTGGTTDGGNTTGGTIDGGTTDGGTTTSGN